MRNHLEKPIIIIGSGRSGTTIISEIIFRHEDLAWPSNYQERFPAKPQVNLIRNVFDNPLWQKHGQKPQLNDVSRVNKILFKPAEAYKFWEHITGNRIDFSRGFLLNERATDEEKEKIRDAFAKMVSYQRRKKLALKITGPSRIGYLKSIFPDAIFINITRDPIPTIQSWLNVDFWQDKGKNQLWWTGAYSDSEIKWSKRNAVKPELMAALQYKKIMQTARDEVIRHRVSCLNVRYEEFVESPASVVSRILKFAGLQMSPQIENYLKKNKIYNQNKEEGINTGSGSRYTGFNMEEIQRILDGDLFSYDTVSQD